MDLNDLNRRGDGYLPGLLGIEFTASEPGLLRARLEVHPEHLAPNGYLHAATVIALADTTCGYGTYLHRPEGIDNFTTIELKANFLGTARSGVIACEARLLHGGRTTQVWDATVTNAATEAPIALFRCTQLLLAPRPEA
ncbi:MAG: PaaI family thioesterase [Dehalococcoidia bacterium]|nr:PaaI family thioesterase [Dehalococcoidia bacterium]